MNEIENSVCAFLQAPDGESQPTTDVDLFVSTEKLLVLNTNLKVYTRYSVVCTKSD